MRTASCVAEPSGFRQKTFTICRNIDPSVRGRARFERGNTSKSSSARLTGLVLIKIKSTGGINAAAWGYSCQNQQNLGNDPLFWAAPR
jgi:hypothetical protein